MPPRIYIFSNTTCLALRPKGFRVPLQCAPTGLHTTARRRITPEEKPLPVADKKAPEPNQEPLPHVSEEAAAMGKITGEGGPEIEQGTPVQEIIKKDDKLKEQAPQVIKEDLHKSSPSGSRSFSTSTRRKYPELTPLSSADAPPPPLDLEPGPGLGALMTQGNSMAQEGHLFGLPEMPMPRNMHLKRREDPLVDQFTKLIMQSGRLSRAQRIVALILERLRTAKPPKSDDRRPLIPGSPPVSHLPLNPVLYLTLAIDSVAPLLRFKSIKGAAGGGASLQLPIPLNLRQRRRTAIMWILDSASKKRSTGSGRAMFANKVADEIIAIVEGRSGVWEKRGAIHKLSVAARANLAVMASRKRFK